MSQDYKGELQIIFSDDFSSDSTFDVMRSVAWSYKGPHKIIVRRNPFNVGIGAHYNSIISISTGDLIVTAAGDDISFPNRVSAIAECWVGKNKKPDLITSNLIGIDLAGGLLAEIEVSDLSRFSTPESWIKKRPYVVGAAHAFTPKLHQKFGDFVPALVYEDQVMAFRATLMGGGEKIPFPLVYYRQGGISQGSRQFRSGADYLSWMASKFSRQYNQYLQIKKDIEMVDRRELWTKKLQKRLCEASLVLDLQGATTVNARFHLLISTTGCSWFFKLKYFIYILLPWFGIGVSRMRIK